MVSKALAAALLVIVQLPPSQAPSGLPAIAWVGRGGTAWQEGTPLFTIADEEAGTSAEGWAAVTDEHILLRVTVSDDVHTNTREGGDIWDGDALQVGIDACGDGSGRLPAGARMVGPDDGSITVALTGDGPKVWAHFLGKYGRGYLAEGARDYPCAIVRDDGVGTTTYDVAFPWSEFGTSPGLHPTLGLAVQVNDTDEGPQQRLYWGRGADGEPRPGLFQRLALGESVGEVASVAVTRSSIWRPSDSGEVLFAVASPRNLVIRARMGDEEAEREVPATGSRDIRRFAVRGSTGSLPDTPVPFRAELVTEEGEVLAAADVALDAPGLVMDTLNARIDELAAGSPHPLFTRHLRSTQALVAKEWTRAMLVVDDGDQVARDVVRDATTILDGLNGQAGKWEEYAQGRRSLVLARVSSRDSTLQYHTLGLPQPWDPARAYPLVVSLHGAGPSYPLFYVQAHFHEREEPAEEGPVADRPYYQLAPWGRGNQGWSGAAEDDLWEAMEDVKRDFEIDEDRQYLTGHSMGGGGAWQIALRTPDRWAAVCPVSGGPRRTPLGIGLGGNVSYVPFRIWHGDADGAVSVEGAYDMQAELRRYGNEPDMVIVPGQGHDYPGEAQEANAQWMLQHGRNRPESFSFVCDTQEHRGAWGLRMVRDVALDPFPAFECRVRGRTVHISSEGTPGLSVQLGQGGLGLQGEVVVYWNGEKAYEGPATEVTLGEGERSR
jgi:pimeloyl-ACP methyl ester carboxylesterase